MTIQRLTEDGLARLRPTIEALAAAEGMPAHAEAARQMRALAPEFKPYAFALPTDEVARLAGHRPVAGAALRPEHAAAAARVDAARERSPARSRASAAIPPGGYRELRRAIADYAGVEPENVVLGAGADDLILLCARCFAGPGDTIAIPAAPTYPLFRIAAQLAGAEIGDDDPVLTFACRPNNPTGELGPLPDARPLVVDEAYFEYSGVTALDLLDDGVIVLRTFSKLFGLAGARVGYALAARETRGRAERPPGACPGLDALRGARGRSARGAARRRRRRSKSASGSLRALRALGLAPLESHANFLYVPVDGRPRARRAAAAPGHRRARLPRGDPRLGARRSATTTCWSRRSRACSTGPRRSLPAAGGAPGTLRATAETRIAVRIALDGASRVRVATGAGLYDHFLEQLAFHAGFDLVLEGAGDLETGDHHTAEDAALALGAALDAALGDRRGIARYGDAVVPMDDALARAAVDLGGRANAELTLELDPGMAAHMLASFAQAARASINVEASGRDAHHVAEAAFKAVGRALRAAVRPEGAGLPSTKGLL